MLYKQRCRFRLSPPLLISHLANAATAAPTVTTTTILPPAAFLFSGSLVPGSALHLRHLSVAAAAAIPIAITTISTTVTVTTTTVTTVAKPSAVTGAAKPGTGDLQLLHHGRLPEMCPGVEPN